MGTVYGDIGRVRVVNVQAKTSTAIVSMACDFMQRGDIIRPFATRPVPAYHDVKLDPFAPPSGKKTAMVVTSQNFGQIFGAGKLVFVNLGSAQGVQVGNYFRVFPISGQSDEIQVIFNKNTPHTRCSGFGKRTGRI